MDVSSSVNLLNVIRHYTILLPHANIGGHYIYRLSKNLVSDVSLTHNPQRMRKVRNAKVVFRDAIIK